MNKATMAFLLVLTVFLAANSVNGGIPLNNLEGVGGVAFNPLAYTAGNKDQKNEGQSYEQWEKKFLARPQIGAWYVHLGDVDIDWTTIGIATTAFKRLEISYGYETIAISGSKTIHKNNIGAKFLLVEETEVIPAVSVGTVWKETTFDGGSSVDDSGSDYYLVATKMLTKLPKPVLLSGGIISTKGRTLGVLGFDKDRDEALFANIDVCLSEQFAAGVEYRQGAKFDDFKNANYWNAHLAWFVNKNLTFVAAYVNAGDEDSSSRVGLGDGIVLSAQYAF